MGKSSSTARPKSPKIETVSTPTFASKTFFTFNESIISPDEVLKAGYSQDPSRIVEFFNKGLDLNEPVNIEGWRLIHIAAQTGNLALAKFLISQHADINASEFTENWTALMVAVFNDQVEIVKLLVHNHANLLLTDKEGNTAADLAIYYKKLGSLRFLN